MCSRLGDLKKDVWSADEIIEKPIRAIMLESVFIIDLNQSIFNLIFN